MTGLSIRARAPRASSPLVRHVMQANVGRETAAESLLRRALRRAGLRFQKESRPVAAMRCTADVVFRRARVCVFVDGCFWHGCRRHFHAPKSNRAWWSEKIEANLERDRRQTASLRKLGWKVVRLWEHEVTPHGVDKVVGRVVERVRERVLRGAGGRRARTGRGTARRLTAPPVASAVAGPRRRRTPAARGRVT